MGLINKTYMIITRQISGDYYIRIFYSNHPNKGSRWCKVNMETSSVKRNTVTLILIFMVKLLYDYVKRRVVYNIKYLQIHRLKVKMYSIRSIETYP